MEAELRTAELLAAQGAGTLVHHLVEVAGSAGAKVPSTESILYDCAVVLFNLAGAALTCGALQQDLVGEGGVLPALALLAEVRWVPSFACNSGGVHRCVYPWLRTE